MKATILRATCMTIVMIGLSIFPSKAQNEFYNTKWIDGKIDTRTKYVMGYTGLYEKNSLSKYTYDKEGNFMMKEVYTWNRKYAWNDRHGIQIPDPSEDNWTPDYCIIHKENPANHVMMLEYYVWNQKDKKYNSDPKERMIYQQSSSKNEFIYLAYQKDEKYQELVNNVSFGSYMLADYLEKLKNEKKSN